MVVPGTGHRKRPPPAGVCVHLIRNLSTEALSPGADGPAETVGRRVYRELRQAIVSLRLRPGEALSEQDIAQRFGVSRQPVREAFIKLAEAGLVRVLPQRGTFVVKISVHAVLEARFVREALEGEVVARAAGRLAPEALGALDKNLLAQEAAARRADPERFLALDEAFHRSFAQAVGCQRAWRVVEDLRAQMDRVRFLTLPETQAMNRIIAQHRGVLEAVAAGEADAARERMRAHLREILKSLPRLAGRHRELFDPDESASPLIGD